MPEQDEATFKVSFEVQECPGCHCTFPDFILHPIMLSDRQLLPEDLRDLMSTSRPGTEPICPLCYMDIARQMFGPDFSMRGEAALQALDLAQQFLEGTGQSRKAII